jgi:hypothetical protein
LNLLAAVLFLLSPMQAAHAQSCEPDLTSDCDEDGFTAEDGDCDDLNESLTPGGKEICDDGLDNNCDGLFDNGCDVAVRQGGIRGGGGCTGGDGLDANSSAAFLIFPLLLWGRKR